MTMIFIGSNDGYEPNEYISETWQREYRAVPDQELLLNLLLPLAGEFLFGAKFDREIVETMLMVHMLSVRQVTRGQMTHIWCHFLFNLICDDKGKLGSLIIETSFEDRESLIPVSAICHRKAYKATVYRYDPGRCHWIFETEQGYDIDVEQLMIPTGPTSQPERSNLNNSSISSELF